MTLASCSTRVGGTRKNHKFTNHSDIVIVSPSNIEWEYFYFSQIDDLIYRVKCKTCIVHRLFFWFVKVIN